MFSYHNKIQRCEILLILPCSYFLGMHTFSRYANCNLVSLTDANLLQTKIL
jgi:hypothetical protein